ISKTIIKLRQNKNTIGTSLHLTLVTKNLLNYTSRIRDLLILKEDLHSEKKWEEFLVDYINYEKSKNSITNLFTSHTDLLALEIVEHTAQKGDHYIADKDSEYKSFFRKGLLGGLIISLFALFKILIDSQFNESLPLAFLYSLNYALCFIIVFVIGGTIATKQPAMTASTIAKHIDKNDDLKYDTLQDIILLLRKISRSQFISLLGNFIMAFSASCAIVLILKAGFSIDPIDSEKSNYLIQQSFPFSGGAIFYAAIAGVFLSISGFISGYFDNKVKASNFSYRVQNNKILSQKIPHPVLVKISLTLEKNLGVYIGNICLGFFLGSSFLLSFFSPFEIDIRHIAFSSSNLGYAFLNFNFNLPTMVLAILSVFLIGLINFLVSFSMTFLLVLKSRGLEINKLSKLIVLTLKDFLTHPIDYFILRDK
ncbi:site-specific recombinase, partial [bacterium]|nr:site-specific recombinase [bacterium]